ncbi:MAG: adenylate/guanylate cyclase domain-containing protein, partial [Bacteroidetes bacterium]|nr:adenylate/guanylate cyclase domain-containing protein [Bacteroidota bacterium]
MRTLAAIMFTDIAGYTALMQKDEQRARWVRKIHRENFNTLTEKHQGQILQYFGDGTLSIFQSAYQAVLCGVELQRAFRSDNSIPVRIGIHLGEIVYDQEEIIGDAVN